MDSAARRPGSDRPLAARSGSAGCSRNRDCRKISRPESPDLRRSAFAMREHTAAGRAKALESASMRLPRPSSLNSLMLTGFALVSIPLLLGVVIAATKVRDLSEESATLVRSGVRDHALHPAAVPADRADRAQRQAVPGAERSRPARGVSRQSRTLAGDARQHRNGSCRPRSRARNCRHCAMR